MPLFRYTAVDASHQPRSGEIDAPNSDAAHRQLVNRGFSSIYLNLETAISDDTPAAPPPGTPSQANSAELAESLASAMGSGLPLAAGLSALAEESSSSRTRAALRQLSRRIAAGESLDAALAESQRSLPPALPAVIRAGQRSRRLPLALTRYVDLVRESRELQRSLWLSLIYPLALIIACIVIMTLLAGFVIPMFDDMFSDFDVELPGMTMAVIFFSRLLRGYWMWMLFGVVSLSICGYIIARAAVSPAVRSQLLDLMPIIGPMRKSFAVARFCRLLALLMDGSTPFPEAVQLAGAAANPGLAAGARRLAEDVADGFLPTDSARRIPVIPRWLVPVFRWHDRGPAFSEALNSAADLSISRSQAQLTLATLIAEPAVIVCIALTIGFIVISMFLPLVNFLNELS